MNTIDAFGALDIRVGTIVAADAFPEAKKPAYRLTVDFGPAIGKLRSSAQITALYSTHGLVGRRILGVVNLPPKRIAGFTSEALILGVNDAAGNVVLVRPDFEDVADGERLH